MIQNRWYCILVPLVLAGCGGGTDKPAEDANSTQAKSGDCAWGEVREGGECVPTGEGTSSHYSSSSGSSSGSASGSGSDTPATTNTSTTTTTAPSGPKTPYDKDSVEIVLRRAALQVKNNCGAATDDSGKPSGPWGQTKVSVTLGRNGHVRDVTIPDPYDGKPTGRCALLAFKGLIFPPYAAPMDVTVDWDVDIEKRGK